MKKATSRTSPDPSAASLREMPEIDFPRYHRRRNPYAAVIARKGASVIHDEPSARSLADLPEVDFSRAQARRSSFAGRARRAVIQLEAGRGRPRRGQEIGPTPARSIRLPTTVWAALEAAARDANTTVHALLRLAVRHLLETPPFGEHLLAAEAPRRRRHRRVKSAPRATTMSKTAESARISRPRRAESKPRATAGARRAATPRRRAARARRRS
jgi:hypothetical protein